MAKNREEPEIVYRLVRSIVIPAGTEVLSVPHMRRTCSAHAGEVLFPLSKDSTASVLLEIDEAEELGLVERREEREVPK